MKIEYFGIKTKKTKTKSNDWEGDRECITLIT